MGTAAHGGESGSSEEIIIRALTKANEPERQLHRRLVATVNGVRFDIAHHGPSIGTRNWTRGNVLLATMRSMYIDCLESECDPPRFYVRAHRHVWQHRTLHDRNGRVVMDGFALPSWKLKDDFAYMVAADALSNIGLVYVIVEPDGRTWWDDCRVDVQQDKVLTL